MHRIEQAKRIIEPFMLRRLKADVLKSLPVKTLVVNHVVMTEHQETRYNTLVDEIKEASRGKEVTDNSHMMWLMMLRKLTNHPLLLRYHFEVICKLFDIVYSAVYEISMFFVILG